MSEALIKQVLNKEIDPQEALDKFHTHSTRLSDIDVSLLSKPLECGFPTIEHYQYLVENESHVVVIAGRPGNCKTALACQIGLNVSKHSRVLYFSLEMKKEALRRRLLAVDAQVPIKRLAEPVNKRKVDQALHEQEKYRFDLIDDDTLSMNDILGKIYDEHSRDPLALVIVDYIGLIKVDNNLRALSVGEVAKTFQKKVADKLKIPVILLAQMNRGFDGRYVWAEDKEEVRPTLADIGESSGIEHAADVVFFVQRPCLLDPRKASSDFKVYVCKNRKGDVKDFNLHFSAELTRFFDTDGVDNL